MAGGKERAISSDIDPQKIPQTPQKMMTQTGTEYLNFYGTGRPIVTGNPRGDRFERKYLKFPRGCFFFFFFFFFFLLLLLFQDLFVPLGFNETPQVMVSLCGIDSDSGTNTRVHVWAENVGRDGFEVVVKTWCDSKTYGVGISWLAIP